MEIDEIKKLWDNAASQQPNWNADQLREVLKGRSRSVIDRMKRSVWFEIALTDASLIFLAIVIYYLEPGPINWLMKGLLLSYIPAGVYFIMKMRLLARFDFGANNLKENLVQLVNKLDSFLRVYKLAFRWAYVLFYFFGLAAVYADRGPEKMLDFVQNIFGIAFLLAYTLVMGGSFMLVDWYVQKLYGVHLDRLKEALHEVDLNEGME